MLALERSSEMLRGGAAFFFALVVLLIAYSPTLIYPYLLLDEAWIVRPGSHNDLAIRFGRPGFALFSWGAAEITKALTLDVIYVMRISAIVGLAWVALVLARWFEKWGTDLLTAWSVSVSALTLPAFQIVVADGTQLAFAILFAAYACHCCHNAYVGSKLWLIPTIVLLCLALSIYQQQALVFFAMLAVPLMKPRPDTDSNRFVLLAGLLATAVSALYFLTWRFWYKTQFPDRVDTRYGPDAVTIPGLDQMADFVQKRLVQAANLWDVSGDQAVTIAALVGALIVMKLIQQGRARSWHFAVNLGILLGLVVACDSFALVAGAYPSYITATALTLMMFYWAFSGATAIAPARPLAIAIMVLGVCLSFTTVRNEIAYPNWKHMNQIETALAENPTAPAFHVVGGTTGVAYQEFGWRNAFADNYLYLTAKNIADHLVRKGVLAAEPYISVGGMESFFAPESTPSTKRDGSIVVELVPSRN